MKFKSIDRIAAPMEPHFVGDGFRVHNYIPGVFNRYDIDPFLMLDYNSKFVFEPSNTPRGVGVHPHKGFETVTIAYKGKVEHADSTGSGGIIHEGDVQWMTAGNGILHKEFHEKEWSKTGGEFQMVQLWVNLPAKDKTTLPKYQNLPNDQITKVTLPHDEGLIEVIAGEFAGHQGAAQTFSPIHLYNVRLKAGSKVTLPFPDGYTTCVLAIEGEAILNDDEGHLHQDHFAMFERQGEQIAIEALSDALILVMSGEPLREPIASHGPFVMNTEAELIQAFEDFNLGKFGYLE